MMTKPHARFADISRRSFLLGAGATAASLSAVPAMATKPFDGSIVRAAPTKADLTGGASARTQVLAYNGVVPGKELRGKVGTPLKILFENALDEPATVHWHGLELPNTMDGVPGVTQEAVAPGESFTYSFTPKHPGTYWYHPHANSAEQLARGLHGILVVDDVVPPDVEHDVVLVIDDWRLDEDGQIHMASFGDLHEAAHGGRMGNVITVNGKPEENLAIKRGDLVRVRLVNVANSQIFGIHLAGLRGHVIALDGRSTEPFEIGSEPVVLGPAQRADVVLTAATGAPEGSLFLSDGEGRKLDLAKFQVEDSGQESRATAVRLADVAPLQLDSKEAYEVSLPLQGGAMGRMTSARLEGEEQGWRDLVRNQMAWALAGDAGMPPEPLFTVPRGTRVRISMPNETNWPHAMHVHGKHFTVEKGGLPGDLGRLRDTVMVLPAETSVISFIASNPGDWVLHCHMLEHANTGMMTWFRVL